MDLIAKLTRWLRLADSALGELMPNGESSPEHYIGGYDMSGGKSAVQEAYERDTAGWEIIGQLDDRNTE